MMVAMRGLFLAASKFSFELKAKHIETDLNVMADAISRGDLGRFFSHARDVLNMGTLKRVEPAYDINAALMRMQKARRAERRRKS